MQYSLWPCHHGRRNATRTCMHACRLGWPWCTSRRPGRPPQIRSGAPPGLVTERIRRAMTPEVLVPFRRGRRHAAATGQRRKRERDDGRSEESRREGGPCPEPRPETGREREATAMQWRSCRCLLGTVAPHNFPGPVTAGGRPGCRQIIPGLRIMRAADRRRSGRSAIMPAIAAYSYSTVVA